MQTSKGSSVTMWKLHTHTYTCIHTHTHTHADTHTPHCTGWQGWRAMLLDWNILRREMVMMQRMTLLPCGVGVLRAEWYDGAGATAPLLPPPHTLPIVIQWLEWRAMCSWCDPVADTVTMWCQNPESTISWWCRRRTPPPPTHTHTTYSTNLCSWCSAVDDTVNVWCENPESRKISWQCRRCTAPPPPHTHTHTLQTDAHGVMQWRTLLPCGVGVLRVERYHDRAGTAPPPPNQHTPQTDGYGVMQWRTLLLCGVGVLRVERYHDRAGTAPPPPHHQHTLQTDGYGAMQWRTLLPCGVGVLSLRIERYHDGVGTAPPPPHTHTHTHTLQTNAHGMMQWRTVTVWCRSPESRKISWRCRHRSPPPHTPAWSPSAALLLFRSNVSVPVKKKKKKKDSPSGAHYGSWFYSQIILNSHTLL